jgi:hypothetical protein
MTYKTKKKDKTWLMEGLLNGTFPGFFTPRRCLDRVVFIFGVMVMVVLMVFMFSEISKSEERFVKRCKTTQLSQLCGHLKYTYI